MIKGKVDIFLINETNLDEFFPSDQYAVYSYKFIIKDRDKFGGVTVFYINDQLQTRITTIENPSDIEILTIEITIRKTRSV